MRLGKNQIHILRGLSRRTTRASASDLSGTAMSPETAAAVLRGLHRQGLARRADGLEPGTEVCAYTTGWYSTVSGRNALQKARGADD